MLAWVFAGAGTSIVIGLLLWAKSEIDWRRNRK